MASNSSFISASVTDITQVLDLVEQAQAIAASRVQEYNKVAFSGLLVEGDFTGRTFTMAQFIDAISSLTTAMPNLLGDHGTNLYRIKE